MKFSRVLEMENVDGDTQIKPGKAEKSCSYRVGRANRNREGRTCPGNDKEAWLISSRNFTL